MDLPVAALRQEEDETADLPLSRLYAWQKALGVPVAELLVDIDDPLSLPVWRRAKLVKMMKSVVAISDHSDNAAVQQFAQTLAGQLLELMPELKDMVPRWPAGWPTLPGNRDSMAASDPPDQSHFG
jgi:hypothetical protein